MYHLAVAPVRVCWNRLRCYSMRSIDEMTLCGFGGTPLPSLQTLECMMGVWLALEANGIDDRLGHWST